jgi:hypothetical protein
MILEGCAAEAAFKWLSSEPGGGPVDFIGIFSSR